MRFQIVDECETCHGSGVVMSEAALQASGDPTVDCPEGGWSDEPTLICNTTRVASTTDLIEELKTRGAVEVDARKQLREGRFDWFILANKQGRYLVFSLEGEKP